LNHNILYKKEGLYAAFPTLTHLPNQHLIAGINLSPFKDHYGVGTWIVLVSKDQGKTWTETNDPSLPPNWPGSSPREKYDRFAGIMPDGSYLCAGTVGWEVWEERKRGEAEAMGLSVTRHPIKGNSLIVGGHKLFFQRSTDQGKTWDRQEWTVPHVHHITAFPRSTRLSNGAILIPIYSKNATGYRHNFVWISSDEGYNWNLLPVTNKNTKLDGSETAILEVSSGCILAHTRTLDGILLERWSYNGGHTWSVPRRTLIWGFPPHLLKLQDGRILCSFSYRRDPMGIRAILSADNGKTWDIDNAIILRNDGGTPGQFRKKGEAGAGDLGYPISIQLSDNSILTAYYITLSDGITHSATTHWRLKT